MSRPLLELEDLRVHFDTDEGPVRAVDGVTLRVDRGEILGLVGESGSGKSVLTSAILRLVPSPPGRYAGGSIRFEGEDVLAMGPAALRALRGDRVAMIFQDPMTSLNPFLTVGRQLTEVWEAHRGRDRRAAERRALEVLGQVGIPDPATRLHQHPHELSGGMRQRIVIAMALMLEPRLVLADEPTTALDVTIQAQILDLMNGLKEKLGTAIMLITHAQILELLRDRVRASGASVILVTHDLGVVAGMADRVAVMYAGRVVESAPTEALFARPAHPYTRGLLESAPGLALARKAALVPIPGRPPDLSRMPPGCAFHPRCALAEARCRETAPSRLPIAPEHEAACHLAAGLGPESAS
jgi:oligopeptide transport system ATP-binding protein